MQTRRFAVPLLALCLLPALASAARAASEGQWPTPPKGTLFRAIQDGSLSQVKAMLKRNPKLVNAPSKTYGTPLEFALDSDIRKVDVAAYLISAGANPNTGYPLADAVSLGDAALVKQLLARGARVDPADPEETSALYFAAKVDIATMLLDHGANIRRPRVQYYHKKTARDRAVPVFGETPPAGAAEAPAPAVVKLLLERGADPNATGKPAGKKGRTALFNAVEAGSLETVSLLLDHGANPNAEDWDDFEEDLRGETALFVEPRAKAAANPENIAAIVGRLVKSGADVTHKDSTDHIAWDNPLSALSIAVDKGGLKVDGIPNYKTAKASDLGPLVGKSLDEWEKTVGTPRYIDTRPKSGAGMGEARFYIADGIVRLALMRRADSPPNQVDAVELQFQNGTPWWEAMQAVGFEEKQPAEDGAPPPPVMNLDSLPGLTGWTGAVLQPGATLRLSAGEVKNDSGNLLLYLSPNSGG